MRSRFWLALDSFGHAIPWLRFGRLRYAVCLHADPYIKYEPPAVGAPAMVPTFDFTQNRIVMVPTNSASGSNTTVTWVTQ